MAKTKDLKQSCAVEIERRMLRTLLDKMNEFYEDPANQCHEVKKSANIFIIDVLLYFQMHSAVKLYFSSVSRLEYTGVIFLGMANRQNPILPI